MILKLVHVIICMYEFSVNDWSNELMTHSNGDEKVICNLMDKETKRDMNNLGDVYIHRSFNQGPMPWNSMLCMEAYLWNRKGGLMDRMNESLITR